MLRLFLLLLLRRVSTEECPNVPFTDRNGSVTGSLALRLPRSSPVLADIVGLDDAKEVLREAVVLPSSMATNVARLFWRSGERSAVLLVGPAGLGKVAAAEAAAHAAGALVLVVQATEIVAASGFCTSSLASVTNGKQPVVVIVQELRAAPAAALVIQQCLREAYERDETVARIFFVATMSHELSTLSATALVPFSYIVQLGLPSDAERKQFLLRLLQQISRIDPQWGAALREAEVSTLVNLTAKYTFGEIELVVRRAFIRSTNTGGERDTVALHHFEQILRVTPPQAAKAFNETYVAESSESGGATGEVRASSSDASKKKPKEGKDAMEGIFGWCNVWLPEALHLPPVVWAMIIFGVLAHFMARSTYQPNRKRRGGGPGGPRNSLFGDMGAGAGASPGGGFPSFGGGEGMGGFEGMGDMYSGGSPFGNFPPPPGVGSGMPGMPGMPGGLPGRPEGGVPSSTGAGGGAGGSSAAAASASAAAGLPTAGEPKAASPPE